MKDAAPHTFNEQISWLKFQDMFSFDWKSNEKPVLWLFHKSWCSACKNLAAEFSDPVKSKGVLELSKKFVMVNVPDDDASEEYQRAFSPDGSYVPRIIFADPTSTIVNITNTLGNNKYKHFFSATYQVERAMKEALERLKPAKSRVSSMEL
ncbi:hypothetical protein CYMTET_6426 [Cymbomonas tetramitiformis]|uniref:Thioredoxin domain-containing protein n=1 Tax=Cymbomonas tetramitiformis TaxID=36881 RepID=A0AAE0LI32_9CHLO|nr:hypothetical protein CYMTET_6426 [Cymbomonas tetramitiformis]